MLQKGIVEQVIDQYTVRVRVPKYDKLGTATGGTATADLNKSILCSMPGMLIQYKIGDVVIVGYENDQLGLPIILGLLYRDVDTSSQITLPVIEARLDSIDTKLSNLGVANFTTYVRYSNDNGRTFTSLYNSSSVKEVVEQQITYVVGTDIQIDKNSSSVYWNVVDGNGVDVTNSLTINTTIHNVGKTQSYTSSNPLINVPANLMGFDALYISFEIQKVRDFDTYHVVLTTDKDVIGTTPGEYIGICVAGNSEAPTTMSSYSWMSASSTLKFLLTSLEDSLTSRLDVIETTLYGATLANLLNKSGLGLADILSVDKTKINLYGIDNQNIYFDSSGSTYIDNNNKSVTSKNVALTDPNKDYEYVFATKDNGHVTFMYRHKG